MIASYNLENYLPMERKVDGKIEPAAPKPPKEVENIVRVVVDIHPDILGVMEMGDESMLTDLQDRLKAAGLDLPNREWVRGTDPERHIALLSRFPIVDRHTVDDVSFEMNGRIERILRGILDVTVQISPSFQLRLVGAHLKSQRTNSSYDEANLRAKEAWQLRKHIDDILAPAPATNLLIFGDLNDTKNDYSIREILGEPGQPGSLRDLWLKDDRGETWTHFWKAADLYSRIDYLLVNSALAPHIGKSGISTAPFWNDASDHRAIYTTVSP